MRLGGKRHAKDFKEDLVDEEIKELARRLVDEGVMRFGHPAAPADIAAVERRVAVTIPASYRDFLMTFGGGGAGEAYISGVFGDEPEDEGFGTIVGDTFRLRELLDLPGHLLVVRSGDDEVPWCLDTTKSVTESRQSSPSTAG